MFHICALKIFKTYVIQPTNAHVYDMFYHISFITNMFRSLSRLPSSG